MGHKEGAAPKIVYAGGYVGEGDFAEHRHENAWELLYLVDGAVTERVGGGAIEMQPGDFVVHPPGATHGDLASSRYFLYHVLVTSERPLRWPQVGHDPEGAPIRAVLEMVVREWYQNWVQRESVIRHCACLLDILMQRYAVHTEESDVALSVVSTVRGLFRREFRNPIDLRAVASDLQISRSTLYAYFRQVLDRTPQEVLDAIRLKHAVYLLRHSELPVEQVAKGSGYCSASHLGRKLRGAYKMTARQIREGNVKRESKETKPAPIHRQMSSDERRAGSRKSILP